MTMQAQTFDPVERRSYIGASEIAAIVGVDKYKTAIDVYNEKVGPTKAFAGNPHTERGNRLESIAAEYYTELTGVKLRRHNEGFSHPDHPFIRGHIDRMAVGEKRIVEFKCPSVAAYRRHQREGLPESYIIQAQVYMGLANAPSLTFGIFCADVWDLASFDLSFDETIYNAAIDHAVAFWNSHVIPHVPPTDNADNKKMEVETGGGSITFRDDPVFMEAAAAVREAWQIEADAKELKELAKAKFIAAIEDTPGSYEGAGIRAYYSERPGRSSLDKDALARDHPDIDLSKYQKQGKPFYEFRPYFLT